jgi:ribulose bisphosphate carboxylase small subunit
MEEVDETRGCVVSVLLTSRKQNLSQYICIEDGVGNDSIRLATTKKEFVIQKPQNVDELSQNKSRTFNFY